MFSEAYDLRLVDMDCAGETMMVHGKREPLCLLPLSVDGKRAVCAYLDQACLTPALDSAVPTTQDRFLLNEQLHLLTKNSLFRLLARLAGCERWLVVLAHPCHRKGKPVFDRGSTVVYWEQTYNFECRDTNMDEHRFILHCDLDAFYASVEQRDQPALRGKAVIVGGSPEGRGAVSTASYEARQYGVHSAMPCRTAQRLCPDAIFLSPRFEIYKAVSQQVMAIFRSHTSLVEPLSLDEAYLDVSMVVQDFEEATELARTIKRQIREATELTASAGVSFSKSLAKLASDAQKPDGLTTITLQQAPAFLDALPVDRFFGVGKVTSAKLRQAGIETGADLKRLGESQLRALLGSYGSALFRLACGEDNRPVEPTRERKSVGKETTFERDLVDRSRMEEILERLAAQVERRLVELNLRGRTLTLKVKWSDFQLLTRSVSRAQGFQEAHAMMPVLRTLLSQLGERNRPVRLLGVSVSNFLSTDEVRRARQITLLSLWEE